MEKKWYERDLRRLLVDMHIPDWDARFLKDFSAENYARMMKKAGITCAEIYAGNCLGLCLFPSETGFVHRQLKGRDILGETLHACRTEGLDVQIYFNVYHRSAFEAHPDWRMIGPGGRDTRELGFGGGRIGLCCINSPFGDFFLKIIDELDSKYEGVGCWIDMLGWWSVICRCDSCKRRFREETGFAIPEKISWNDPVFTRFVSWRASVLAQFAHKIVSTIKKRHPERTVTIQSASVAGGWNGGMSEDFVQASEYLAGDFTGDHIEQSVICKLFSALSKNRPMEFMTP
ncbi:MAG: alpha-L-fucosidase, partial [Lentisphaeria bacterium]|nr:alpha-L-fucosidase [Lentisphaeria bacterium]